VLANVTVVPDWMARTLRLKERLFITQSAGVRYARDVRTVLRSMHQHEKAILGILGQDERLQITAVRAVYRAAYRNEAMMLTHRFCSIAICVGITVVSQASIVVATSIYLLQRIDSMLAVGLAVVAVVCSILSVSRLTSAPSLLASPRTLLLITLLFTMILLATVLAVVQSFELSRLVADRPYLGLPLVFLALFLLSAFVLVNLAVVSFLIICARARALRVRSGVRFTVLPHLFESIRLLCDPRSLNSTSDKRMLIEQLHEASKLIGAGLWRGLALESPGNRAVFLDRCRKCSQVILSYELWVALPAQGTRTELLDRIATLTRSLMLGYFDEMPFDTVGLIVGVPQRLRAIGRAVWVVFVGLVPLACIFLAWKMGFDVSGYLGGGLIVAGFAWFALTFAAAFDTLALDKMALFKAAMGAIGQFKGGGK
jgi:hypothetical protein